MVATCHPGPRPPYGGAPDRASGTGSVKVVLTQVGGYISGVGVGVTLLGGFDDHLSGLLTLCKGGLPRRHGAFASFDSRLVPCLPLSHGASQPRVQVTATPAIAITTSSAHEVRASAGWCLFPGDRAGQRHVKAIAEATLRVA